MEDIHFGKICFLPSGCEPFSALSPHECQFRWPSDNLELGTVTDIFVVIDGEISYTAKDYRWMDLFFGNHEMIFLYPRPSQSVVKIVGEVHRQMWHSTT